MKSSELINRLCGQLRDRLLDLNRYRFNFFSGSYNFNRNHRNFKDIECSKNIENDHIENFYTEKRDIEFEDIDKFTT